MITKITFDHTKDTVLESIKGISEESINIIKESWGPISEELGKKPLVSNSEILEIALDKIPDNLSTDEAVLAGLMFGHKIGLMTLEKYDTSVQKWN